MASDSYDGIVIGTGPGGSTLTYALARRGAKVLVVERGDFLRPLPNPNPVGIFIREHRTGTKQWPVVGGDSKYYGAALYRLREADFRATQLERGESPGWPISYSDLEPYYTQAERLYGVRGASEGDPSEPPRSTPYPFPPIPHQGVVAEIAERIRSQGVAVAHIPKGLDYGPGGRCVLCSTCDGYYCQLDAKMDAEVAALRPALKFPNVELVTKTECVRVLTSPDGKRATGVVLRQGFEERVVRARFVAVCGGVSASPLLLRRSESSAHPEGLGNATGCLGRYLTAHSTGFLFPVLGRNVIPPLHTKTLAINAYYSSSPGWAFPTGVIQLAGQVPLGASLPRVVRPFFRVLLARSAWVFHMTEALGTKETGMTFNAAGAVAKITPPQRNPKTVRRLRRLAIQIFRCAGYRVVAPPVSEFWHPGGTARMGSDPSSSVVDAGCQVHGVAGLYVVDSSTLPSVGAVNTTLTVVALALRVGEHLV